MLALDVSAWLQHPKHVSAEEATQLITAETARQLSSLDWPLSDGIVGPGLTCCGNFRALLWQDVAFAPVVGSFQHEIADPFSQGHKAGSSLRLQQTDEWEDGTGTKGMDQFPFLRQDPLQRPALRRWR